MSGKDTHVRGLRVLGPIESVVLLLPISQFAEKFCCRDRAADDDPFSFKTTAFKMYETIR